MQFVGEEGIDEGGVQKEFFQLIISQVFDVSYGMFTYDEALRSFWFNQVRLRLRLRLRLRARLRLRVRSFWFNQVS